jgi:hypothetical protein
VPLAKPADSTAAWVAKSMASARVTVCAGGRATASLIAGATAKASPMVVSLAATIGTGAPPPR